MKMAVTSNMESNNSMIKNTKVNKIFDDLDAFRQFCVDYGYVFNEKDLYRRNSHSYVNFERAQMNKSFADNWAEDSVRASR
jgi:hypothetical protein